MENIEDLVERAQLLLDKNRPKDAEEILAVVLSHEPEHINALGFMIDARRVLGKYKEAMDMANDAIGLYPDIDYFHYQKSLLLILEDDLKGAKESIDTALSLDPEDTDYYTILASIYLDQNKFKKALEAVDMGLSYDAKNSTALSTRSRILVKLKRKDEANVSMDAALEEDADNSYAHAARGMNYLENNKPKEALEAFSTALEIDPMDEYAKEGMMTAVKAQYALFRWMLRFSFWLSNMPKSVRWGLIIGILVIVSVLRRIGKSSETLAPFMYSIVLLYGIFSLMTYFISPMVNFLLRFNPYGKLVLTDEEIKGTNLIGASLLIAVIGLLLSIITGNLNFLAMTAIGVLNLIPIHNAFRPGASKKIKVFSAVVLLSGLASLAKAVESGEGVNGVTMLYFLGIVAFIWITALRSGD